MAILLLADSQQLVKTGLALLLQGADYTVAAQCSDADELLRSIDAHRPDIVMLGQNILGKDPRALLRRLKERGSCRCILLLDDSSEHQAADLILLDFDGFIPQHAPADRLLDCVHTVHLGERWFDPEMLTRILTLALMHPAGSG
jgi:DNA-binding NarL/FixJ family response regulator